RGGVQVHRGRAATRKRAPHTRRTLDFQPAGVRPAMPRYRRLRIAKAPRRQSAPAVCAAVQHALSWEWRLVSCRDTTADKFADEDIPSPPRRCRDWQLTPMEWPCQYESVRSFHAAAETLPAERAFAAAD